MIYKFKILLSLYKPLHTLFSTVVLLSIILISGDSKGEAQIISDLHNIMDIRYSKACLLFAIPLLLTCSQQDVKNKTAFEKQTVKKAEVFLSTESSDFLGRPSRIKAYDGGLYFSDDGFHRVTTVNRDKKRLFTFGSEGRGPGEFQSLAGFWVFQDSFLVYDYNGFKFIRYDSRGNFIEEKVVKKNPVNPEGYPPNIPITVHAISPHELLIPSRGRDGSLFGIADIETGDLTLAGKAVGEHVESYDQEMVNQAYANEEIPNIFKNMVIFGSSSSGIYSFQQTTGLLEKYSGSGELLWKKSLIIPEQKGLFDQIASHNREAVNDRSESTHLYNYVKAMDANEFGVAVLLNMSEGSPVTVCWVPDNGKIMKVISFPDLDKITGFGIGSFSVSPADQRAYFLNNREGIIYEAKWPI